MTIQVNGETRVVRSDLTVAGLLRELEIQTDQVAVEVNLHILERMEFESRPLQEGDCVEILSYVGGGAEAFFH